MYRWYIIVHRYPLYYACKRREAPQAECALPHQLSAIFSFTTRASPWETHKHISSVSSGYLSPHLGADTAGTKLNRAKGSFFLSWKEFEWPLYANMLHMGKHIYVHETNVTKTVPQTFECIVCTYELILLIHIWQDCMSGSKSWGILQFSYLYIYFL